MSIFFQLLKTDLKMLYKNLKDKAINAIIWTAALCIIATYILPAFGTSSQFSLIEAMGLIVGAIGFEIYTQIFLFLSDLEGEKHITYYFTLPIPNWLVFVKMATLYTINGLFLGFITIPVIKLIQGSAFHLMQINLPLFVLSLLVINVFFSFFAFFLISLIKNLEQCENIAMRIWFPLWFFGGFSFSFKIALSVAPIVAYISLISPYTYATEAVRSAVLGAKDFMPIWVSLSVLMLMTLFTGYLGIKRLQKRLDFI